MEHSGSPDIQRQIDELVAQVASNRADIDALTVRADAANDRADAAESRADDAERRVDAMEAKTDVDREMIADLQADGIVSQEQVKNLEAALVSSRTIGCAIGILMASRNIGQDEALTILKGASQRTNIKMRDLALSIVSGADDPLAAP